MIIDTTPHGIKFYAVDELRGMSQGQLVTLALTYQHRIKTLEAHVERLESVAGASTIRNAKQCPTCGHERSREVNQGRARRCERCKSVWAVD